MKETKTKDQQAQEYAEKSMQDAYSLPPRNKRREEMWIRYSKQIECTGLSSCRYYACNSCERGTRKKCIADRISDCKYYQPRKHGGKKK